ncbi:MAG: DUF3098 domain-containing protein [Bacteroidia bacterium]|jgi:hypothetical protein|nr:DUF3098 domain-containing protein [Bacteroidales bacterium]MDD3300016.1 DUF3098 domain-containing protein [Bacteroidales bacterium]MDD3844175.1 DUF3098 domain-containing protein [Bacteroidales bacterium]MDD4618559.1 DUF3098 domain-containing protein [Bacteroidales bacterium]NCC46494.1 DUF3098 domain-containing protein [Bacteroidia bacterium]
MNEVNFALPKKNLVFILAGLVLLILGYALMTGGGTTDPNVFPEEQMFSFRRITLAPFLILLGFAVEVFAIMYVPKGK